MQTLKYRCARCPGVFIAEVKSGDKIKKSIKCTVCGTGRMRLSRQIVVTSKDQKRKTKLDW